MGDLHKRDLLEISTYDTDEDEVMDARVEDFNGAVPDIPLPQVDDSRFAVFMSVGKPLYNWLNDVLVTVRMPENASDIYGLPNGDCKLVMYSHGLAFIKGLHNYTVSFDQVLAVYPLTESALAERQIGKGALCPDDGHRVRRFVIEYWDVVSCSPVQLVLQAHKKPYLFLNRLHRQMSKKYEAENRCKYVYNIFGENGTLDAVKFTKAARTVPAYVMTRYVAEVTGRKQKDVTDEARVVLSPHGLKVEKPISSRWINVVILLAVAISMISLLASL